MYLCYFNTFIPVIGLIINMGVQIVLFRSISRVRLLQSIILGFVIGLLTTYIFSVYAGLGLNLSLIAIIWSLVLNGITYSSLGYCYFVFINLGETARRIRILRELKDSPRGLTMDEILARYNAQQIVEQRLSRLINSGQTIYKDGKYYIGQPIMLLAARFILALKCILLGRRCENN